METFKVEDDDDIAADDSEQDDSFEPMMAFKVEDDDSEPDYSDVEQDTEFLSPINIENGESSDRHRSQDFEFK